MSKGRSGRFSGTYGAKSNFLFALKSNAITSSKTKSLDLREHPRCKSLTAKQRKEIRNKITSRIATKEEYKKYSSDNRFLKRRKEGVRLFWLQEKRNILSNKKTTRVWNLEQKKAILEGRTPKYKGKSLQGHHIYSASKYPHLANKGELIFPVTVDEHLHGWHGGNYRLSTSGKPLKSKTLHNFMEEK